jgi:hypothetical protein
MPLGAVGMEQEEVSEGPVAVLLVDQDASITLGTVLAGVPARTTTNGVVGLTDNARIGPRASSAR